MAQHGLPDAAIWAVRRRLFARPARDARSLSAARSGPIVVAGMFRTASGVGESARATLRALAAIALLASAAGAAQAGGRVNWSISIGLPAVAATLIRLREPVGDVYARVAAQRAPGRGQQRVRFPNLRILHECRFECFYRTGMVAPR